MQDPRIRIGSAALLSVAAFISVEGAFAAFIWWLVFTPRITTIKNRSVIAGMLILIGLVSVMITVLGGNGVAYFVRMGVIILIGAWAWSEQQQGEFLSMSVWCFGKNTGFTLGLIAESGMLMADALSKDVTRIRIAQELKGLPWGITMLIPTGCVLINDALVRADETAELLAVRGYRDGGSLCPEFVTPARDGMAGFCAICAIIFAFIPLSEFFILYR